MKNIFLQNVERTGASAAKLHTVYNAARDAPHQIKELSRRIPQITQVMDSLSEFLPLTPNASVGPHCGGAFYRLPNHFRSVSYLLPPTDDGDADAISGAIVFKGTEPLLPDFGEYYDWMLTAPLRASQLPLGLHFPMDLRIPPAAMWIAECISEQEMSTRVQSRFLAEYGEFGRLPVPLYVFKYTDAQVSQYAQAIRSRISDVTFRKISSKLDDGLGVEVYFYPSVPVRVADLYSGNMSDAFGAALSAESVEETTEKWIRLFAELLQLRYMPYVSWHHGMGACIDYGNACLDGGFNDLLTLSPIEAIPSQTLVRRSLAASIRTLAETIAAYCNVAAGGRIAAAPDSDAMAFAQRYVWERTREQVRAMKIDGRDVDDKIMEYLERPSTADIVYVLREDMMTRDRKAQYVCADVRATLEV